MLSKSEVLEVIRHEIRSNRFVPGQRLVEAELCEMFDTSRGNVRAALMDLTNEGLVERVANRGARVRAVSVTEALHISEARMALEVICVERVTERITDRQIAEFQQMGRDLVALAEQDDPIAFFGLTTRIRDLYLDIADQPVARDIIQRLRDQMARQHYRLTFRPGRARASLSFWLELIEAFSKRDPEAAADAIRAHRQNVQDAILELSRREEAGGQGVRAAGMRAGS